MKNERGFTLVELLVTLALFGILTMTALPLLDNLQESLGRSKYDTYKKSVENAGRLYGESNEIDLFGNDATGCIDVPIGDIADKNLIEDIDMKGWSCFNDQTFVRIRKNINIYEYEVNLVCKNKKGKGTYKSLVASDASCR